MKKKLLALTLALLLVFGVSLPAMAVDNTVAILGDKAITLEELNSSRDLSGKTLTLTQDVTLELIVPDQAGVYMGLQLTRSTLDLNGFTLTLVLPEDSTPMMVTGISCVDSDIINGNIVYESSVKPSKPSYTYIVLAMQPPVSLENVELVTAEDTEVTAAVNMLLGQSKPVSLSNCMIDVGDAMAVGTMGVSGTPSETGVLRLESGSYKNLTTVDGKITITGTELTPLPEGVDANTTIIVSADTTAIIVDNGNAYLYDTLQDAVDDAAKRTDEEGAVTIHLLKQPESTVQLPENIPVDVTLSKLDEDNTSIIFGNINITDADGNIVTVDENGNLEFTVAVDSVTLDKTSLDLTVGDSATLNAKVEPENATYPTVIWTSSNPNVATVDSTGKVTALKPGTTTITAKADGKTAECTVTVSREPVIPDPNGITVTQPANGTLKVNPSNGSAGTLITVTATPDQGYELAYITVDGEKISGNTFRMPDKAVTVSAVFVPVTFPFVDVKTGDWFYDYVAYVYSNGLMNGVSATEFSPNTTLNRAMIWTMLARLDGVNTDGGANWYAKAQAWAMAEGVSDGTDPMGAVTREQLVTMLWRFKGEPTVDFLLTAKDADTVSSWAYEAMRWAVAEGIIEGDENGLVTPTATATRAQAAAIFMRFIEG